MADNIDTLPPPRVEDTTVKPAYHVVIGTYAGAQLTEGSEMCLFVGRNAGRNVTVGKRNIIIGDDIVGENTDDQFIISEKLPVIEDLYLVTALQLKEHLMKKVHEHYAPLLSVGQQKKLAKTLDAIFDASANRVNEIQAGYAKSADESLKPTPRP